MNRTELEFLMLENEEGEDEGPCCGFLTFYLNTSKALATRRLREYTSTVLITKRLKLKIHDWSGWNGPEAADVLEYSLECPERPLLDGRKAVITHEVIPLASERVKVKTEYNYLTPVFLVHLQTTLEQILENYPEANQRMFCEIYGWTADDLQVKHLNFFNRWLMDNGIRSSGDDLPAVIDGAAGANGQPARAEAPVIRKPQARGRSKPERQAKIKKLFEEENKRDLTVAQMAKLYGVTEKTIYRDLRALGLQSTSEPP